METKTKISLTNKQIKRFYNNIKIDEQTGCHIYVGCKDKNKYGVIKIYGKIIRAHRIAWFLYYGDIINNMLVLHKCDNPSCVNPEHLFLGTQNDNIQDMVIKNRHVKGEINSKLKEYQVKEILDIVNINGRYYGITTKLAKLYNVSTSTIKAIIERRKWKYLKVE
jgi:hypothetical protein